MKFSEGRVGASLGRLGNFASETENGYRVKMAAEFRACMHVPGRDGSDGTGGMGIEVVLVWTISPPGFI